MKSLLRYKISTLLNIIGLGIALATAYVIGVQIYYTLTYNSNIPDSERVFVLEQGDDKAKKAILSMPIGNAIGEKLPSVEAFGVCSMAKSDEYNDAFYTDDNATDKKKIKVKGREMSASATEIMGFTTEEGDLRQISQPNTIAISRSLADKWKLKVGDRVYRNQETGFLIVGIFSDMPDNCTLAGTEVISELTIKDNLTSTANWNYTFVYKLRSADDAVNLDIAKQIMKESSQKKAMANSGGKVSDSDEVMGAIKSLKMELTPMSRFYLHDSDQMTGAEHSSQLFFNTCCAIFVLILFVAFFNYVNFYMALVPRRIRGINIHKVFGYSNWSLRGSIILESAVLVAVALLLAAVLATALAETSVASFFNADIRLSHNVTVVSGIAVLALVLAVTASLYPAWYITSMPPVLSLKGSFGNTRRGRSFRMALLLFQFTVALSLIISSLFVYLQYRYMMNADLGFKRDHLMTVNAPQKISHDFESRTAFESKLRRSPLIADVAWASGIIVAPERMGWGRDLYQNGERKNIHLAVFPVSWNFLRMLGIPVVEGRNFNRNDEHAKGTAILNMTAKREFQVTTDGQFWGIDTLVNIVGICEDIKFRPMKFNSEPLAFYVFGENTWGQFPSRMYFRTTPGADLSEVRKYVTDMILEMAPDTDIEDIPVEHFDEQLSRQYENEQNMSVLLIIFAAIAVTIALIGVFGLVLFDTQYRRREVAVRRIHGTRVADIIRMYNVQYLLIVAISFVLSVPLCYYVINRWLEGYANHIPVSWWVFAVALLLVAAITMALVTLRCVKSAMENPVEALKSE